MADKVKVRFKRHHLAYVNQTLLHEFQTVCCIVNYLSWVQKTAHLEFGITLDGEESIQSLQQAVEERFYDSIGDWLQDKMRRSIRTPAEMVHDK